MKMRIEFLLTGNDKKEIELMDDFCMFLVREIRKDILNSVNEEKLQSKEKDILNASWIVWTRKPRKINMDRLLRFILNNIRYKKRKKHRYLIDINPKVLMPYSRNPIEQIARFIDKGNERSLGTNLFTRVFMRYRLSINDYWKSFVSLRLKRLEVNEVILIK